MAEQNGCRLENAPTFGAQILRALGIDPGTVTAFRIDCVGGDFPTMTVHRMLWDGDGAKVRAVLEQYALQPKSAEPLTLPKGSAFVVGSLTPVPLPTGGESAGGQA